MTQAQHISENRRADKDRMVLHDKYGEDPEDQICDDDHRKHQRHPSGKWLVFICNYEIRIRHKPMLIPIHDIATVRLSYEDSVNGEQPMQARKIRMN